MFYDTKTLIVVYKDEMLVNQLKKLVAVKDDMQEGNIIGTCDDTIKIVSWTEKIWLNNKKAGNINSKILFLGDIKGVDKLIPVLDVKFDSYGVKYGWAGDQAAIYVDVKELKEHDTYLEFLDVISRLPIPNVVKYANKPKETTENKNEMEPLKGEIGAYETLPDEAVGENKEDAKTKISRLFSKSKDALMHDADTVSSVFESFGNNVLEKAHDLFMEKAVVTRQMLFYGIIKLYNDGLDTFMRS